MLRALVFIYPFKVVSDKVTLKHLVSRLQMDLFVLSAFLKFFKSYVAYSKIEIFTAAMFLFQCICQKVGVDPGDRLSNNTKKRKWLVRLPLPPDSVFPPFQDFEVVHHYLQMRSKEFQARVRKRGQKGRATWIWPSKVRVLAPLKALIPVYTTKLLRCDPPNGTKRY